MTTTIYGHEIELEPDDDGGMVTDVLVIARHVRLTDDGRASDTVSMSGTTQTTGIVQGGMIATAQALWNDAQREGDSL